MESACSEEFSLRIFLSYRGGGRGNFSSGRHRIHRDDFSSGIFGGRAEAGDCGGMDSGRDCEPEIKCRGGFYFRRFFCLMPTEKTKERTESSVHPFPRGCGRSVIGRKVYAAFKSGLTKKRSRSDALRRGIPPKLSPCSRSIGYPVRHTGKGRAPLIPSGNSLGGTRFVMRLKITEIFYDRHNKTTCAALRKPFLPL